MHAAECQGVWGRQGSASKRAWIECLGAARGGKVLHARGREGRGKEGRGAKEGIREGISREPVPVPQVEIMQAKDTPKDENDVSHHQASRLRALLPQQLLLLVTGDGVKT